ncbi:CaiB/BaiF CoA-transferase family protein [Povalibacter sp.]|uniref:CaiB/BaiF CoA transferase family protein n=1 Tax=Povalibacter sp. TaxID=1962978 RepID=UPI002F4022FD
METTAKPLDGIRVIDLTRALAGPYATLLLAGLGAEVIKIEDPVSGDLARDNSPYVGRDGIGPRKVHEDDISISHLTRGRGKYGVSLNLKSPHAVDVFRDLVSVSDVVVENFTSGTADRLGIGYEAAKAVNPRIVYCSLSGFGAGVAEGSKAMDVIIQALSGAMFTSGNAGAEPVRFGIPVADMLAPVFAVIGILSALQQRERTKTGQHVDVSMLGALTSFVAIENWHAMELAGIPSRTGLTVPRLSPFGVFRCADGYVSIVAVHDGFFGGLCQAMDLPLADDKRFSTRDARVTNAGELERTIGAWCEFRSTHDVVKRLTANNVPVAPVRSPIDALSDSRVLARGEVDTVQHPAYPSGLEFSTAGVPILFSGAPCKVASTLAVSIGQHNEHVYRDLLGYSPKRLEELRQQRVI